MAALEALDAIAERAQSERAEVVEQMRLDAIYAGGAIEDPRMFATLAYAEKEDSEALIAAFLDKFKRVRDGVGEFALTFSTQEDSDRIVPHTLGKITQSAVELLIREKDRGSSKPVERIHEAKVQLTPRENDFYYGMITRTHQHEVRMLSDTVSQTERGVLIGEDEILHAHNGLSIVDLAGVARKMLVIERQLALDN